jgi:protein TonB
MPAPLSEEPARPVAEPLPAGEDERGTAIGGAVVEGGGSESSGEANDEASGPREFQDSMIPPQRISGPDPQYTPEALEREVEGTMRVKCVVTVEGTVHGCRVLQSLPFMDRAVIEALERRRYTPARENGRPVEVEYVFVIRLKL